MALYWPLGPDLPNVPIEAKVIEPTPISARPTFAPPSGARCVARSAVFPSRRSSNSTRCSARNLIRSRCGSRIRLTKLHSPGQVVNKPNDHSHMARVYGALRNAGGWLTNVEIAEAAGVAERTARKHTAKLAALGLVDMVNAYPSHQFKLRAPARLDRDGQNAMAELEKAMMPGTIVAISTGRDFSEHKALVYRCLRESLKWMTSQISQRRSV